MMFLLNQVFGLVKILNSQKGAWSVAAGFALGMVLGLVPANPIISVVLLFLVCIFRINLAATLLGWGLFAIPAYLFDPQLDRLGYWILTHPQLQEFFTKLYNMPVLPWSRFNNTIVCGSLAAGLALFLPTLFIGRFLIQRYRDSVLLRLTNSKFFKAVKSTKLYQLYEKYESVKGALS